MRAASSLLYFSFSVLTTIFIICHNNNREAPINRFVNKKKRISQGNMNFAKFWKQREAFKASQKNGKIVPMEPTIKLSAKELVIACGETSKWWKWFSLTKSSEVAEPVQVHSEIGEVPELVDVHSLEIRGKLNTKKLAKGTLYEAYLVFKKTVELEGFINLPLEATVGLVGGVKSCKRTIYLVSEKTCIFYGRNKQASEPSVEEVERRYMKVRGDGWLEVELGDFFNNEGEGEDEELELSILELEGGHSKGGIIIEGIEIRPKTN